MSRPIGNLEPAPYPAPPKRTALLRHASRADRRKPPRYRHDLCFLRAAPGKLPINQRSDLVSADRNPPNLDDGENLGRSCRVARGKPFQLNLSVAFL